MSYENDPREKQIRPESGITLEQDDRFETMYHWGAMVLDLCDLPVEEYMKPMEVRISGSGGGGGGDDTPDTGTTPTTKSVSMTFSITDPSGNIIDSTGSVIGSDPTGGDGSWHTQITWSNTFNGNPEVSVVMTDSNGNKYPTTATINGASGSKSTDVTFENVPNNVTITKVEYVFADTNTNKTTVVDEDNNINYQLTISMVENLNTTFNIKYSFASVSDTNVTYNNILSDDAESSNGYTFDVVIPISEEYVNEYELFDNEEGKYEGKTPEEAQEILDEWEADFQEHNAYSLKLYVPSEFYNDYTYELQHIEASTIIDIGTPTDTNIDGVDYKCFDIFKNASNEYRFPYIDIQSSYHFNLKINLK